jgi:muramoyltetrapeptide carboxypeptidase LdcA involved in peptidoglycan recycling
MERQVSRSQRRSIRCIFLCHKNLDHFYDRRRFFPVIKLQQSRCSWGGPGAIPHRFEIGKQQLEFEFGIKVVPTQNALRDAEWIKKNPKARAEDLMEAFADPTIKGIFSTIGGDDSIRILPFLELDLIRSNPKIFLGFSDTTITHFACWKAGLGTFYGSSIMCGFAENRGINFDRGNFYHPPNGNFIKRER